MSLLELNYLDQGDKNWVEILIIFMNTRTERIYLGSNSSYLLERSQTRKYYLDLLVCRDFSVRIFMKQKRFSCNVYLLFMYIFVIPPAGIQHQRTIIGEERRKTTNKWGTENL